MGLDASLDLAKAMRAALLANAYISGQVGSRILSSWGDDTAAPLIRFEFGRVQRFEMDGAGDGSESRIALHVFTSEATPMVALKIAEQIRTVLQDASLSLDGSHTVAITYDDTIPVGVDSDDPDLQHVVVRFTALTTAK